MSDWSNVSQLIGQLGQTKRDMLTPKLDAYRNRGKVWSEGLGRISDTLGGIANRRKTMKFQTGEREAGEAHDIAMQTSEQNYQANQNVLDRALERDKIWASLFEGTQDRDAMRKEAALDRQLQRELRAAAESATNERQKAELDEQVRQFDVKVDQWKQEFDRQGLQWDDEMGLRGRELDIREQEAKGREMLLNAQLAEFGSGQDAAWRAGIANLKEIFPDVFEGVDLNTGYGIINSLDTIRKNNPEMYDQIDKHFRQWIVSTNPKFNKELSALWETVSGPPAEAAGETPVVNKETQDAIAALGERISRLANAEKGGTDVSTTSPITGDDTGDTAGDVFANAELRTIIGKEKSVWSKIKQLNTMAEKLSIDDINAIKDATNDIIDSPWGSIRESSKSDSHMKKLQGILDRLLPAGYRAGGYSDIPDQE